MIVSSRWVSISRINASWACSKAESDTRHRQSRFAIADCFVAGAFEEVDMATQIERKAVGLAQTCGLVKAVYGGPGNVFQNHLLSWDNRNATIASSVPTVPTVTNFLVVFAGPITRAQELVLSKQHECDGGWVKRLDTLLRRVNPLYREVKCNRDFVGVADPLSVYCPRLSDDCGSVSEIVNQARHRQQTVTTAQEEVAPADETTLVSSETVLIETSSNEEQEARLARALDAIGSRPAYVARRSASVLRKDDPFYMDRVFPHLLTFGIGGFSSQRSHKYSKRDIVLHYLNLSTNCFTEDPLFKLKMFDSFSTQRVQNGVFMSVKRSSEMATREMHVTPEELDAAIDARVSKKKVAKAGRPITRQTEVGNDSTLLLKSIYASAAKMRRLLHFNMDSRMLGGGQGGLQATRYAIQYATKQETVLDNASVVELAFRRRIEREAAMASSKTELERGLGRFMSLAYSSSSAMEVGGPLVTTTLFEDGAAKFSCQFERLVVIEALNLMENEDVNTLVVERGGKLFTDTSIRQFHQLYYLALDEASDFHAQQAAEEADEACDHPDVLHDHGGDGEDRPGLADILVAVESDLCKCIADSPEVDDEETANVLAVVDEAAMQMLLSNNVLGGTFPGNACGDVVVRQTPVKKAEVAAFENQLVSETAQTT
ncbi:hypothetical protein PRIC2_010320 [Phytophthora ramorum]